MSWLTVILQSLPAILAAISQLWAIIGPLINHQKAAAMAAAGQAVSAADYHTYVTAQGAGFTALAAALACCQPTANRAFGLLRKRIADQQAAALAAEIEEQIESLPAGLRDKLRGK